MRARPAIALALLAAWLALPLAAAGDPALPPGGAQAQAAIGKLHEALLDAMKNAEALGFEGRVERIRPALLADYDFPFMAEKSVGLRWKDLDPAQRASLVDAFSRLAIATYAARFEGWSGERFEMLGVEPAPLDTLLVRTRIVRPDTAPVPLDYRMRNADGQWRIIDVFLNGTVSELALRRAEYSSVLKREGFDALLRSLEEKIAAQGRGAKPQS